MRCGSRKKKLMCVTKADDINIAPRLLCPCVPEYHISGQEKVIVMLFGISVYGF